jgi:DNA-binding CsgD family transcriptional regulator
VHQQRVAAQTSRDLIRLCHVGLDSRTLRLEVVKRLRSIIPFDGSCFITADPATLLFTGSVVEGLEAATPQLIENELLHDDVNKFSWLVRSNTVVGDLALATKGERERSRRYREILAPHGIGDELRAALLTDTSCWGFLCLHRARSCPPFTPAEARCLARLTPHLAQGLRTALLLGSATGPPIPDAPGMLLLAEDLSVAAITPAAQRWLAEISEEDWPRRGTLPHAVYTAVARLRALEQTAAAQPDATPRAHLHTASGHWLTLHASRLAGPSARGQVAVIVEVARPAEVAPLIMQAYDLSKRESEILQGVLRGDSTAEMAASFTISSHTVQDHLKAIFEKAGVRSRRELVGRLFAQHYQPRIAAGHGLDTHGWFTS